MSSQSGDSAEQPAPGRGVHGAGNGRTRLMGGLVFLFIAAGLCWFGWWLLVLRFEETTDNAYVAGNLVRVSPQVTGNVQAIFVDNNEAVSAGQMLLTLDATDAELGLNRARSALADAVRQTRSLMAESDRLTSLVALRQKELDKARGDYERRRDRKTAMAVSEEELSHARDNLSIAESALQVARDDMQRNFLLLQGKPLHEQPVVKQQAHLMREAWLALQRCSIKSPVDGFVARRNVQVGMHVTPGDPLMAVVPLREVWVDANFKEVQLTRMRVGQPVKVIADIYGGSAPYEGTVSGFSAGTGSSFSLLPPENATGNWIKVVQRVPVKILLRQEELTKSPLLVGLSCTVAVDVRQTDGLMLAETGEGKGEALFRTDVLEYDLGEINREIENVIRLNTGDGE